MTHNTPQDHTPIGAGPAGLIRHLSKIFLTLMLASLALIYWGEAPRISLGVIVAAICVMVARLVIEHRSGVPRQASGATTAAWLIPVSVMAIAVWWFPAGSYSRTVAMVLLAFVLSLGAVQFFKWRATAFGRYLRGSAKMGFYFAPGAGSAHHMVAGPQHPCCPFSRSMPRAAVDSSAGGLMLLTGGLRDATVAQSQMP